MKRRTQLDRRSLLRAAAASSFVAALGGPSWTRTLAGPRIVAADPRAKGEEPVLVLIQLNGGNDGLSTVVPYADDHYGANRKATRIADKEVLKLDDQVGLHPNLKAVKELYDEGHVAVIQGCGYPHPNRSHFKSMEIWQSADERGRAVGEGWIGRLCTAAFGDEAQADRVVHIGGSVPFSLASRVHGASSFVVPEGYRWVEQSDEVADYDDRMSKQESGKSRLDFLRGVLSDARKSSVAVRRAAAAYQPSVPYADDPFAFDLMAAAALIHGGIGVRVLSAELTGFDTHSTQRGSHDNLMRRLDRALAPFLRDLAASPVGREVVVVVFSEFGRRLKENGSNGTDHGAAGPMFVAGTRVKGGLHGRHPSLEDLDNGDLKYTTDFRSVYGAALRGCFEVDPVDVLGAEYPRLDLIG